MTKTHQLLLLFSLVFSLGFTSKSNQKNGKAEKIISENFANLHKVNDSIYRSEQPDRKGMQELESLGIKTIINLRNRINDKHEVKKTQLTLIQIPINSWKFSYAHIVQTLVVIDKAKKPVLIHCLHGSDRTGAMVAAYRVVFESWSKQAAITEFLEEQYGYHAKWFPKILDVLKGIDVEALKRDVGLNK